MQAPLKPTLIKETLRALRGKRAQSNLSRLLGYSFNQVYLWETGRRAVHWADFEKLCAVLKRPLHENLQQHFQIKETGIQNLLRSTMKSRKQKDVAKALGLPESRLSRWMRGISDPPLWEVFRILHFVHQNFPEFIDDLAGPGRIESLQPIIARHRLLRETLYDLPFTAAVAPALGLKGYLALKKHEPGFLADRLGISLEQETKALKALEETGQIEVKEGKYKLKSFYINTTQDRARFLAVAHYWSGRAAKLPKRPGQKSMFGYRVFGITESAIAKIRQAQIDYYNALTAIIRKEEGPFDHVMVINFQAFLPDEDSRG